MRLTLAEPKLLKESISIISDLVMETKFRVGKDFIEIVAMDPANVAMVIFRMPSNSFAEYDVSEDTVLSMNLQDFKQVLKRAKLNDVLTLEKADNKLKVILKEKNTRTFYLPLLDLEDKPLKIPELSAKASVSLTGVLLNEAVEDMDIVSESVTLTLNSKSFIISATGDLKNADVVINKDENVKISADEEHKSKYSIEYLKKMIQGNKLVSTATLKFSNDYPLTLEYAEKDKLSLTFILAPRVDND